jgi:hypothetical protein
MLQREKEMWEYTIILLILVIVGYWIFHPLFRPRRIEAYSTQMREDREKALQQRKEEVYAAIKEMDFDLEMGKISEDDYQELKSQYKAKALEILKELDTVDGGEDIDAAIERDVHRLRKKKKKGGKETVRQINFCPHCGRKIAPKNNFCQGCGMKLVSLGGSD